MLVYLQHEDVGVHVLVRARNSGKDASRANNERDPRVPAVGLRRVSRVRVESRAHNLPVVIKPHRRH